MGQHRVGASLVPTWLALLSAVFTRVHVVVVCPESDREWCARWEGAQIVRSARGPSQGELSHVSAALANRTNGKAFRAPRYVDTWLWQLADFEACGRAYEGRFDYLVRLRPDTFFHGEMPRLPAPGVPSLLTSSAHGFRGVNDAFFITTGRVSRALFEYARFVHGPRVRELCAGPHRCNAERVLQAYVRRFGARVQAVPEFKICRVMIERGVLCLRIEYSCPNVRALPACARAMRKNVTKF